MCYIKDYVFDYVINYVNVCSERFIIPRKKKMEETKQKENENAKDVSISKTRLLVLAKKIVSGVAFLVLILILAQVINADKYRAVVRVVDEKGQIGVNPTTEKLDFGDLAKNASMVRYINVNNGGKFKVSVMVLKFGNISDLIKVQDSRFVVSAGETKRIRVEMFMPPSANKERYSGWVVVFKIPLLF